VTCPDRKQKLMILISGVIELAPKDIEPMKAAAADMAVATRQENGCQTYAFYQDIENPAVFRVFEEWESGDALKAHFQAPHMGTFRQAMANATFVRRELTKYDIAGSEPLG